MNRLFLLAALAIATMLLIAQLLAPSAAPSAEPSSGVGAGTNTGKDAMFADDSGSGAEIHIPRDSSGQFHLKARVNGSDEKFLIDTGADVVAMTVSSAEVAGLPVDPSSFQPMMQTASGEGLGARFKVDDLEVAGKHFRDQEVVVLEGLSTNLLGQTILRQMGRVELKGDKMVIAHN